MPLLEVINLTLSFGGIRALAGVSLAVAEGETLASIGPNGPGKPSPVNCVAGLYRPQTGAIRFEGEGLLGASPDQIAARGVARTFQNLRLFQTMSVLDNLLVGRPRHIKKDLLAPLLRLKREEILHRRRVEEILKFLSLEPYRRVRVGDCPFGVQKRVELGRALAAEPRLLLLDEPVSGLTSEEKAEFSYWVRA